MGTIFGLLMSIAGGGLLWFTWTFSGDNYHFVKTAKETEGVVFMYDEREGARVKTGYRKYTNTWYSPRIEYSVPGNQEIFTLHSNVSSIGEDYPVGTKVTVLYNPENPNHSMVKSYLDLFMPTFIGGLLGIALCSVGMLFVFSRPRVDK